jgi:hypothetical protein
MDTDTTPARSEKRFRPTLKSPVTVSAVAFGLGCLSVSCSNTAETQAAPQAAPTTPAPSTTTSTTASTTPAVVEPSARVDCSRKASKHFAEVKHQRSISRRSIAVAAAVGLFAGVLAVSTAVTSASVAQAAPSMGSAYSPISPIRVADSRDGFGISSKLASQDTRTLKVVTPAVTAAAGVNAATVTAVAVQVTATQTTGPGHFTVFPADKSRPLASSLNVMRPNHTITNLVSVPVSPSGEIKIFAHSGSHVVVDVQGVFVESNASRAGRLELRTQPTRVVDTRVMWPPDSETSRPPGKLAARSTTVIDLKGTVPETASAVVVNLTSVNNAAQGFLTAFPYGSPLPNASNLNYPDPALRTAVGSQGYVALKDGKFNVYSLVETDLVVDVAGYFTGSDAPSSSDGLFVPVAPYRMLDTREASNSTQGLAGNIPRRGSLLPVPVHSRGGLPDVGVSAVSGNLTLTQTSGPGWARMNAGGVAEAETSNVNSGFANHTVANHVLSAVSDMDSFDRYLEPYDADDPETQRLGRLPVVFVSHGIAVRTSVQSHLVFDATGYFIGDPVIPCVEACWSNVQPGRPPSASSGGLDFERVFNLTLDNSRSLIERADSRAPQGQRPKLDPVIGDSTLDKAATIFAADLAARNVLCGDDTTNWELGDGRSVEQLVADVSGAGVYKDVRLHRRCDVAGGRGGFTGVANEIVFAERDYPYLLSYTRAITNDRVGFAVRFNSEGHSFTVAITAKFSN